MTLTMQKPTVCSFPEYRSSVGQEAVELAAMAGLVLDPWQAFVLEHAMGERPDGRWATFEVGLVLPRQNGKDAILEARELAGLFLLGERLLIHSAHEFPTSLEHFRRLLYLVENTPELDRRVRRVTKSHGEEGIELKGGQRIRFRTRTKGGGRGFSADFLALNEAMMLPETAIGALLPTLSARPNPQVWYCGSAVDQMVHEDGIVLARVRERGRTGDQGLAYFEWAVERETIDGRPYTPDRVDCADDEAAWAEANPGLGIRISVEHVDKERRSMDPRTFAVERLGVGDWPATDGSGATVISLEQWDKLVDSRSKLEDPVAFAFDIAPDRASAAIAAAGSRPDGLAHIEVVEHRRATGWVVDRLAELVEAHEPIVVVCDLSGPAASLLPQLEELGIEVQAVNAREHANACGTIFDLVDQEQVRHLAQPNLRLAVKGAVKRPLGDAWAWSRRTSAVDISPLVACTLALWGWSITNAPNEEPAFAWA